MKFIVFQFEKCHCSLCFTVFWCSSDDVRISGISSTCGQHIWDMLSPVSMLFGLFQVHQLRSFLLFTLELRVFGNFRFLLIDIKMS